MPSAKEVWLSIKEQLKKDIDSDMYESYIADIGDVFKEKDNLIYLVCESSFIKSRIQSNFLQRMNSLLMAYYSDPHYFMLLTKEEAEKETEAAKSSPSISVRRSNNSGLNEKYTFSNFIVGDSNRVAHRYAMLAANQLAGVANPIYIFGDVGLGKTHLMQAIGNRILENNPDARVLYVKTQDFVEDYVKAGVQNGYAQFSDRFNDCDVLLVDDIQFLESKKQSQLEFFKIFERLTDNKKLIVLTSDRKAADLTNIMARLTSRFEWGMSLDITKPNKEHRISILKSKLNQELLDPSVVPNEVIEYIATVCESNIRELEGALRKVLFYHDAFETEYSVESAQEALKNIINTTETIGKSVAPTHELKKMLDVVSTYFKIDQDDLLSSSRKKEVVYARELCWYIMRVNYDLAFQKIGDIFNGKDHSTIMHGFTVFQADYETNESTRKNVENVLRKMGKSSNEI